ncbi:hypothetical protein TNCV_1410421 [Trichonephila clavipes]|nr:hypothetical protein TNCV_1410421 [Trichonephila clavipes]
MVQRTSALRGDHRMNVIFSLTSGYPCIFIRKELGTICMPLERYMTATAGSDVVQSGRLIFDDFFQRLWPYIGNNTANVVFQMVKRLWLIRIDQ